MCAAARLPAGAVVKWPILFWVSRTNPPGVALLDVSPVDLVCVALGEPYTFGDVVRTLESVLCGQGVALDASWFVTSLAQHGLDPVAFPSIVGSVPST